MIGFHLLRRFGLFLLLPVTAMAGQEAMGDAVLWLQKMARAAHEQNYEGDFVYDDGERMEALHIVHRGGKDGMEERERIVSLNGSGREVVRAGGEVVCIFPESRQVYRDADTGAAFRFPAGEDLLRLQRYYEITVLGRDRVADRPTVVLAIMPRESDRYGYRLWLDEATALAVKSELVDPQGVVVERLMFTRLRPLKAVPEARLQAQVDIQGFKVVDNPARLPGVDAGEPGWLVSWLPGGFRLTGSRRKNGGEGEWVQLVFGDGFSMVSVFIEPDDGHGEEGVLVDKGAVHGYSLVKDGHRITAIGELPMAAVTRIARSVRPQELAHVAPTPSAAMNP